MNNAYIRKAIESAIDDGYTRFAIFPFGEVGMQTKTILKEQYGIEPTYIFDNKLCKYNGEIHPLTEVKHLNSDDIAFFLAATDSIYLELRKQLVSCVSEKQIYEFKINNRWKYENYALTKVGKYSSPCTLRNHWLVESIGAFCSVADGVDVISNHPISYLSTHPFLYGEAENNPVMYGYQYNYPHYEDNKGECWFFPDVKPQGKVYRTRRITIGNDVWLGKNVLITNGANIGNGVIAAAGAVIIDDVPDYAIVGGVPAKIIRFRYSPEQIQALNAIKWWDWPDEIIRERYDDFFIPIDRFIGKYYKKE